MIIVVQFVLFTLQYYHQGDFNNVKKQLISTSLKHKHGKNK